MEILHIVDLNIKPLTLTNRSINSLDQLLITLSFYATRAFQRILGDTMNISQSTVKKIVHKVTSEIASLKPNYIKIPTDDEYNKVMLDFFGIVGFTRVLGAIDCTHSKISSHNAEL